LAKIAVELDDALTRRREQGTHGCATPRMIAAGDGWSVADVLCTSGPQDRPFEEQHAKYVIAVVMAGSFQYRSIPGCGLMTPGSLLLGNPEQCYECGHEHGEGDRCVSFWYAPEYFERLAAAAGVRRGDVNVTAPRLPPLRLLSPLVVHVALGITCSRDVSWEEIGITLAARTVRLVAGISAASNSLPPNAEARVTRTVRMIDQHPDTALAVGDVAQEAGLSPYHFLRTFERLTGVTPHTSSARGCGCACGRQRELPDR
jgi:AraC family transcriptional regulator